MNHALRTSVDIDAPPSVVWDVLVDLEAWADWNPFIVSSSGSVAVGEQLTNRMEPPGGKGMTFKPRVTEVVDQQVFEWLGRLGLPGIFDGRHRFELSEQGGQTRLEHTEAFSGLLVPFMRGSLDGQTLPGFEAMNAALKARAEARARAAA
jgi:hypothetical protein